MTIKRVLEQAKKKNERTKKRQQQRRQRSKIQRNYKFQIEQKGAQLITPCTHKWQNESVVAYSVQFFFLHSILLSTPSPNRPFDVFI